LSGDGFEVGAKVLVRHGSTWIIGHVASTCVRVCSAYQVLTAEREVTSINFKNFPCPCGSWNYRVVPIDNTKRLFQEEIKLLLHNTRWV